MKTVIVQIIHGPNSGSKVSGILAGLSKFGYFSLTFQVGRRDGSHDEKYDCH